MEWDLVSNPKQLPVIPNIAKAGDLQVWGHSEMLLKPQQQKRSTDVLFQQWWILYALYFTDQVHEMGNFLTLQTLLFTLVSPS